MLRRGLCLQLVRSLPSTARHLFMSLLSQHGLQLLQSHPVPSCRVQRQHEAW